MSTTDLAVYTKIKDPVHEAKEIGKSLCESGMLGIANPGAGMVVAMCCMMEGITPLEFGRTYHIINGRPSMKYDAMMAKFRNAGGRHKVITRTPEEAAVELTTPDGDTFTSRITWEEAEQEAYTKAKDGTLKDNYKTPRLRMQMLYARAISDGIRVIMPEIVCGIYTEEETRDMPPLITEVDQRKAPTMADLQAKMEADAKAAKEANTQDADFEMKEPVKADAHPDAEPPFVTKAKEEFDATESEADQAPAVPLANDLQIGRFHQLAEGLGMSEEVKQHIIEKREVDSFEKLTARQADEIIAKLESMKQQTGN